MTLSKPSADKGEGELDEILTDLAPLHDDDDYNTCASNFSICQVCGRKEYFMNIAFHPCTHTAVSQWVPQECDCEISKRIAESKSKLQSLLIEAENRGGVRSHYDPNRLGTYVFIGDSDRLTTLDDLYWSYVQEFMAETDPWSAANNKGWQDLVKKQMKYANFGAVGMQKALARADQRAKERLAELTNKQEGEL